MKAIVLEKAGGPENLLLREVAVPEIKENEVLVETKSISLNPADVKPRYIEEVLDQLFGKERPIIFGWDIAGVVTKVGANVSKLKKGDKVFGMVNFPGIGNAYAEYVAAPEDHLALMPSNVNFEKASATTLAALTAYQIFKDKVKEGDRVLVQGGSGGVGHYAIQIAKAMGAYVITTASGKNSEFIDMLGADEHIDYTKQNFEEVVSDIDFALDIFGGEIMEKTASVMKNGGILFSTAAMEHEYSETLKKTAKEKNIELGFLLVTSNGEDMQVLAEMLADERIIAKVHKAYPFEQMQDAHREVEKGNLVGKVVVTL